jgi:uncharacterized membrane protein
MRGKGIIVGVFCGLMIGLLFRKPAIAILLGIGIAYLVYRNDKTYDKER